MLGLLRPRSSSAGLVYVPCVLVLCLFAGIGLGLLGLECVTSGCNCGLDYNDSVMYYSRNELLDLRPECTINVKPKVLLFDVLNYIDLANNFNDVGSRPLGLSLRKRGSRAGSRRHLYTPSLRGQFLPPVPKHVGVCPENLIAVNCANISLDAGLQCTKSLNFGLANVHSIRGKTTDLMDHIISEDLHVCALTETWLKPKDTVSEAALSSQGYNFEGAPRPTDRVGGGTGLVFSDTIECSKVSSGELNSFEFSQWKLKTHKQYIMLIIIYRPPYSTAHPATPSVFFSEFSDFLEDIVMCPEQLIICGDFNFHMDLPSESNTVKFKDLLTSFGLQQHVSVPTHDCGHCLDLIITRCESDIIVSDPHTTLRISDHDIVQTTLRLPTPSLSVKNVKYRKIKQINIDNLCSDIIDSELCETSNKPCEKQIEIYNKVLTELLDKHAPLKEKTIVSRPCTPWFTSELKAAKQQRRKAERQFNKDRGNPEYRSNLKRTTSKYSSMLNNAKKSYYSEQIEGCNGNTRKLFSIVNTLCKKKQDLSLPPCESVKDLANNFGKFFVQKIEVIREKIENIDVSEPDVEYGKSKVSDKLKQFKLLSCDDVKKLVVRSSNASCMYDPIPTPLLKQCADELVPFLTNIVNTSLQTGVVPHEWKCAVVFPLLKKAGLEPVFPNYRPVSNLSFVSKLAEKVVVDELVKHCNQHAPFPDNQSAYRSNHSTETALLKVQSDILMNMDRQEVTLLVLLDLSSAFDTVEKGILMKTLECDFGITDNVQKWLLSYLTGRKQKIAISGELSDSFDLASGVPQGSCLGPVLFVLYASRIFSIINSHLAGGQGYADDTQIYLSFKPHESLSQAQAVQSIESCISEVRDWMLSNKLMINDAKTEFLLIGSKEQLKNINFDSIKVGDSHIVPVKEVRNLGAWFDNNMSMNTHVTKVCQKAFYGLYHIQQIRKYLTKSSTQVLVHAFVTCHLDYCNSLLYGLPQYQHDRLQRVLNAAARVVCLVPKFDHITPHLQALHWLPVKFRIEFKILLLVYKAMKLNEPAYLKDMLHYQSNKAYSLRSQHNQSLYIPPTKRMKCGDRAFFHCAPTLWNALPANVKSCETLCAFKNSLKTYLFTKAYNL